MPTTSPHLSVSPTTALVDVPITIRITGCPTNDPITLQTEMRDDLGRVWSAAATFTPDADATVDPARHAPTSGTYAGADAMGIFWSMSPDSSESNPSPFVKAALEPTTITITTSTSERAIASATLQRLYIAPGVTRASVNDAALVGTLFLPPGRGPHPGVLVLGGSSGGTRELQAALLASHGYAALALAYFGCDGLPAELLNIPLEYGINALEWLQSHADIHENRLAVVGTSRGAELALLLAAACDRVRAVVAYAPTSVVWGATGHDAPAWTHHGVPLLRMPNRVTPEHEAGVLRRNPLAFTPLYAINLGDDEARAATAIPVERIHGPILLISGEDDQMWPSALMGDQLMRRLATHHHPYADAHLHYPDAGHLIDALSIPHLPTTINHRLHRAINLPVTYGGTPRGNSTAARGSWSQVLAFLAQSLT